MSLQVSQWREVPRIVGTNGVVFQAGDSVKWVDGQFTRFGTVVRVEESADASKNIKWRAVVRAGHGVVCVPVGRLEAALPAPKPAKRPVEAWEVRAHLVNALRGAGFESGFEDAILADVRVWNDGDTVFVDCREGEYTQAALFQLTVVKMPVQS